MATYVLVPGAGGEAWYWHRLVPELEARGQQAIAVDLPAGDDNAGWAEYADAIEDAIGEGHPTQLILVAQSLAGFSAPIVAERRKVDLIVLLNAMIPMPGETGEAWWSNTGQMEASKAHFEEIGVPPSSDDRVVYFHDVPAEVVDEAYRRGEPEQSWTPMTQPWPLERWPDVPTRVLAGKDDRLFPVDFQKRVARERLEIEADVIDGGHLVGLSRPAELADRLEQFREELGA